MYLVSNRNNIKNRVEKNKLEQFFLSKSYSFLIQTLVCIINPRRQKTKTVTRRYTGVGWGVNETPTTFDNIYPTDLKFGTSNELSF